MPGPSRAARADIRDIKCDTKEREIDMNLKIAIAILMILSIIGLAVVDAKSIGRSGKSSGVSSKSVSSKTSHTIADSASKAVGITTVAAAAKSTEKKVHLDDDILENDTENESNEQLPGMQALSAVLAIGVTCLISRRGLL